MSKNNNAYYQMVAQNFLRNISLDGSHQDTALKIFNEKGFQTHFLSEGGSGGVTHENASSKDHHNHNHHHHHHQRRRNSVKILLNRRRTDSRGSPTRSSSKNQTSQRKNIRDRLSSFTGGGSVDQHDGGILSKISNKIVGSSSLSVHHHHPKINWNLPSATSEESLAKASVLSPKGELKLVFPNLNKESSNINGGRICICSKKMPIVVYSIIPYRPTIADKDSAPDNRSAISLEDSGLKPFNFKSDEEISYSPLLIPNKSSSTLYQSSLASSVEGSQIVQINNPSSVSTELLNASGDSDSSNLLNRSFLYDANLLDNCEFGAGKHKATLTFTSFLSSIIDYVDPNDLKKEVNEKFKKRFPELRLSYSKYKSLKLEMKEIAAGVNMDLLTLAHAYVYFDKVVLKAFINKTNRKYLAGVGLILAAKMNDVKGHDLRSLIQKIEETFRVTRKDLFEYELPAAVALEFTLHVPVNELSSQYQKLLQAS